MFPISQNICDFLSKRELGDRIFLENFRDQRLIKNMNRGNYTKTVFNGHGGEIISLDVQNYLAATLGFDHTIKLWNLETGKCLWTFDPEPKIGWKERIKIVEGNIVCAGLVETSEQIKYGETIRIINLRTGFETASITGLELETENICIIDCHIFCTLNDGNIGEWDLKGRFIRLINSEKISGLISSFFGSENFLVHTANNKIMIHNLNDNKKRKIKLKIGKEKPSITSAHLYKDRLICGFSTYKQINIPDFCIINLKNGNIIAQYQVKESLAYTKIDRCKKNTSYLKESGAVWEIITNKEWVYLGHSTGTIVAVNLAEKTHVVLGKHTTSIDYLAIEGQILISGSDHIGIQPAELKLWNIKSLTKIAEVELPSLLKISFASGKILGAIEGSLIQWDYLIPQKED